MLSLCDVKVHKGRFPNAVVSLDGCLLVFLYCLCECVCALSKPSLSIHTPGPVRLPSLYIPSSLYHQRGPGLAADPQGMWKEGEAGRKVREERQGGEAGRSGREEWGGRVERRGREERDRWRG